MHANISVFIPHKACRNECVFCNQRRIASTLNVPTPEKVKEMLSDAVPKLKEPKNAEIAFFGGSFTGIEKDEMKAYLSVAKEYVDSYGLAGIRLSTRPDYIDREILDILKEYGVKTVELGAQSMCDEILSLSKRGHTAKDTEIASALIKEYGFDLILQMMTGLPGDSREKTEYTAQQIAKLKPYGVRIYPVLVIRDTVLTEMYEKGEYVPLTIKEAVDRVSKLILFFEDRDIKVIRIGLHSDRELTDGDSVVAGPFHSAFGELCESAIYRDVLQNVSHYKNMTVYCPKGEISKVIGQKRNNIEYLKNKYNINIIKVKEDPSLVGRSLYSEEMML